MPRDPRMVAALRTLAEKLPNETGTIFEASVVHAEALFPINDQGYNVSFEKTGYTATGFRNIHYDIEVLKGKKKTGMILVVYVVNPSTDATVNRQAAVNGVNHLLSSPETVLMSNQDVLAS